MNDVKLNVSQSKGYEGADLIKVENKDGVAVVGSRVVAKDFGKRHADVIRAIEEYLTDAEVRSLNCLIESSYIDSKGEDRKEYLMTRDGFSLLVMGFKGKEALQWKLKYIDAFNKMEHVIQERSQKAVDKGYFKHVIKGGHSTMVITAKGVEYLRELFLDEAC